jgi:alpha-tubulin suppressor-like RCC1 family protein
MAFTTQVALAVVLGVSIPGSCNWWRHGHGHGGHHGPPECNDHPPQHKKAHWRHCETECTEDQYETESGECRIKATAVSAGAFYSCAVLSGGGIKCWGSNGGWGLLGTAPLYGTLGDEPGEMGDALPIVPLGAGLTALDVYADGDVTCALIDGGTMKCWGYNGYGLATGNPMEPLDGLTVEDFVLHTFSSDAVAVAAGSGSGLALLADGTLQRITTGTFALSFDGALATAFARNSRYDNWDACIVTDDATVLCRPGSGGLAPNEIELGTGRTATDVSLGRDHYCALLDDASIKCWGLNTYGQLGQDDTTARDPIPGELGDALLPIALGQPATAISAGEHHTCAILADGSVKCWGRNDLGQLGIGTIEDMADEAGELAALPAVDLGTGRTAVAIDAGWHTCALLDNGGVKCWGRNASGELGQGDVAPRGVSAGQMGDALPEIDLGE